MKKQQVHVLGCLVKDHKILLLRTLADDDETTAREIRVPGGIVSYAEDPRDSLMRHYLDQTGLIIEPFVPFSVTSSESEQGDVQTITIGFLVEPSDIDDLEILAGDEEFEIVWMNSEELFAYDLDNDLETLLLTALELSHGETDSGLVQ